MKMFALSLWVSVLLAPCFAQDNKGAAAPGPDFSGDWVLDTSKSKLVRGGRGAAYISTRLVISHRETEFRVIRKFTRDNQEQGEELTYYTDGRGETHPLAFGIRELKTKTKWDGARLVSKWTWSYRVSNDTIFTDGSERREMSKEMKLVFNRAS